MVDSSSKPSRARQMAGLNWISSPSRAIPHGLSGLVSVAIGVHLIHCSIVGDLYPYTLENTNERMVIHDVPFRVIAFALATFWNALGGYRIINKAPPDTRPTFRKAAILQLCLSYYILRFLPHTSRCLLGLSNAAQNTVHAVDVVVTATSVFCTLSFLEAVIKISKKSLLLSIGIGTGIGGILLLSAYPIQLSLQGEAWWRCIQDRYPWQASGMVAYIYIPATVSFSLILFGASLFQRKIFSATEFGIVSTLIVVCCLLATVLSQEVHIPDVSTQRIYLPCHEPPSDSFEGRMVQALDFSRYARSVLTYLFAIKFH